MGARVLRVDYVGILLTCHHETQIIHDGPESER